MLEVVHPTSTTLNPKKLLYTIHQELLSVLDNKFIQLKIPKTFPQMLFQDFQ
jgi:hypothetical protein